ncbi:MAG: FliH/SctL family protein [Gammaproteobacteria bacterium]|nr:FliH/SctL family protein [Gammaproteobacteria bacterium]
MSKIFNVDEDEIKHWVLPEVQGNIVGLKKQLKYQTVEDIEALQKQAYEEARQQGYQAGKQEGLLEMQAKAQQLQNLITFLEHPLENLDEDVEKQLTELAFTVARLLLKKECCTDIDHVQAVIHEALEFLPMTSRNVRVRLNRADVQLLQQGGVDTSAQDWVCVEDNTVTQGGCLVESDQSHIDASVETRIAQLVDQLTEHRPHYDEDNDHAPEP